MLKLLQFVVTKNVGTYGPIILTPAEDFLGKLFSKMI